MNADGLLRALQSVGMTAFVTHLRMFEGPLPNEDAAAELSTLSGCRTRVSRARSILKAGQRDAALRMIAGAGRVPDSTRDAARAMLTG